VARAVYHCRTTRRPTFLHLRTTRIMGHAGTDFEIEWRSVEELMAVEATGSGLLRLAAIGARGRHLYKGTTAREVRGGPQTLFRRGR
jgi:hypothetical protein